MVRELRGTTSRTMHHVLLIFETFVCAAHGFPGMGDFLFGHGEEEWGNEVAKRRKERY